MNIGIDFGNVLSIQDEDKKSRNISMNMPFALEALLELKSRGHKLFLISFCGKSRALETSSNILKDYPDLFENMFFTKSKKYKLDVCQFIDCHILIDDTLEIIEHLNKEAKDIITIHFHPENPTEWKNILNQIKQCEFSEKDPTPTLFTKYSKKYSKNCSAKCYFILK